MSHVSWQVPDPLDAAASGAFSVMASGYLAGRILATLTVLLWGRARARAVLIRIDALKAIGRRDAARSACEAALDRCERRRRALAGRLR